MRTTRTLSGQHETRSSGQPARIAGAVADNSALAVAALALDTVDGRNLFEVAA